MLEKNGENQSKAPYDQSVINAQRSIIGKPRLIDQLSMRIGH